MSDSRGKRHHDAKVVGAKLKALTATYEKLKKTQAEAQVF